MLSIDIYSFSSRTSFDPFFFPSTPQHPSPAAWQIPPQQPPHRRSFFINDSYELSVFEQKRFTFDQCLASSNFAQQWIEIPSCCGILGQHRALGRQLCSFSCPCTLCCPSHIISCIHHHPDCRWDGIWGDTGSPRHQGESPARSGSHGTSPDRPDTA